MIELMFLFFMKNVSQCGQNVPFISKVLFKYKQGTFQITPFDGMVLKIVLGFDKASAGCGFVTTYESLDLDLSYYNSLRVFNLLQNEDLELYPKR